MSLINFKAIFDIKLKVKIFKGISFIQFKVISAFKFERDFLSEIEGEKFLTGFLSWNGTRFQFLMNLIFFGTINFKWISVVKSKANSEFWIFFCPQFYIWNTVHCLLIFIGISFQKLKLISFFVAHYLTVSLRGPVLSLFQGRQPEF